MTTVNKILSGLILITAMACCTLAIFLYQQRIELRNRADYLARVASQTAQTIDGKGQHATEIGISGKVNEESLNWQSYKAARDDNGQYSSWEEQADLLIQGTEKLTVMKQNMAESLIAISQKVDLQQNEGDRVALNSALTYSSHIQQINNHIETFKQVKDGLHTGVNELSSILGFEATFESNESPQKLRQGLSSLIKHSSQLVTEKNLLTQSLQDLDDSFAKDKDGEILFQPSWSHIDFNQANADEIRQAFSLITKDIHSLNQKLYELKVANQLMDEQRTQLAIKDNVIQELNHENDQLKNINGSQKASLARISRQLAEYQAKEKPSIPEDIQAEVIEVNDRFNFLVINKGRQNGLITKADLLIHSNGQYICKARVSKVLKDKAICDILPNPGMNSDVKIPTAGNIAVSAK